MRLRRVRFTGRVLRPRLVQGARQDRGVAPLLGVKILVARAERQAVGLANRRTGHDFHGHAEVVDHLSDDAQLLAILLAEIGAIGLDEVD